jgi:hypothetical protein
MDVSMASSSSTGNKRSRDAADGATEVGQGNQAVIPRSIPHLYNNHYTVRLTYAENFVHVLSQNGSGVHNAFRSDSIYDPNATGGGHQPLMRDLWASQYDYYAVLACEYKIRLYNGVNEAVTFTSAGTNAQSINCINATLLKTVNGSDFTSGDDGLIYPVAEYKNSTTEFLPPDTMIQFNGSVTPGDFILDAKDSDSDPTWTAVGSNPTVTRYVGYVLCSAQPNGITGVNETPYSTVYAQVILDYTVQFTQMNQGLRTTSS